MFQYQLFNHCSMDPVFCYSPATEGFHLAISNKCIDLLDTLTVVREYPKYQNVYYDKVGFHPGGGCHPLSAVEVIY